MKIINTKKIIIAILIIFVTGFGTYAWTNHCRPSPTKASEIPAFSYQGHCVCHRVGCLCLNHQKKSKSLASLSLRMSSY